MPDQEPKEATERHMLVIPITCPTMRDHGELLDALVKALQAKGYCKERHEFRSSSHQFNLTIFVHGAGVADEFKRAVLDVFGYVLLGFPGHEVQASAVRVEEDPYAR